jgi:hypothetical protein
MKTYVHLWSYEYFIWFVLEWETFQTKIVEKITTRFIIYFFLLNQPNAHTVYIDV